MAVRWNGALLALVVAVGLPSAPARADALLDRMLTWAPAPVQPVWSGPILFGYARTDLMFAAAGGGDAATATELLAETRFMAPSLMTVLAYPQSFFSYLMQAERWPQMVGFDVTAVDAILTAGAPPDVVEIYAGTPDGLDPARIGPALEARGFARKDVAGVPVWARFQDYSISIADRDPADPFGGVLGQAARIAVSDGILARSAASAPIAAAIAGSQGGPSLGAEPAVRALTASFGDDTVVQVTMFGPQAADPAVLLLSPDLDPATLAEQLQALSAGGLPGYYLAALAQLAQPDGSWRTVVSLAFPDAASAEAAAPLMVERARAALPPDTYARIDARVVPVDVPGFAVARLDITAAADQDPLRRLFQMLMRRDAAIWAVGTAP